MVLRERAKLVPANGMILLIGNLPWCLQEHYLRLLSRRKFDQNSPFHIPGFGFLSNRVVSSRVVWSAVETAPLYLVLRIRRIRASAS